MPSPPGPPRRPLAPSRLRARVDSVGLGRRLLQFWLVWTALILVHEAGHAWMARRQGFDVDRITIGVGPALWRSASDDGGVILRLVPVVGVTRVADPNEGDGGLRKDLAVLSGGALATMAVIVFGAAFVTASERRSRRRCVWARIVIADALVLTVFNFLPLPPLDGGRAALSVLGAWKGAPFSTDTLFWLQLGGLALAFVPMVLWTSWTRRLDAIAMRWRAPLEVRTTPGGTDAAGIRPPASDPR